MTPLHTLEWQYGIHQSIYRPAANIYQTPLLKLLPPPPHTHTQPPPPPKKQQKTHTTNKPTNQQTKQTNKQKAKKIKYNQISWELSLFILMETLGKPEIKVWETVFIYQNLIYTWWQCLPGGITKSLKKTLVLRLGYILCIQGKSQGNFMQALHCILVYSTLS